MKLSDIMTIVGIVSLVVSFVVVYYFGKENQRFCYRLSKFVSLCLQLLRIRSLVKNTTFSIFKFPFGKICNQLIFFYQFSQFAMPQYHFLIISPMKLLQLYFSRFFSHWHLFVTFIHLILVQESTAISGHPFIARRALNPLGIIPDLFLHWPSNFILPIVNQKPKGKFCCLSGNSNKCSNISTPK